MRYNFTPTRMPIMEQQSPTSIGEGVEKFEPNTLLVGI
jgi:hypothetical protein